MFSRFQRTKTSSHNVRMKKKSSGQISQKDKKKLFQYMLYMTIFCAVLLFYVYQHIQALRYGYAVEEKLREQSLLQMENDSIVMKIKQYTSLPRLEKLAKEKLGLKIANKNEIVVLTSTDNKKQKKDASFLEKAIKKFKFKFKK